MEGGLGAPTRHPLRYDQPDFYDEEKLDAELRRVFDICHGCRRCFNLCDSFPRLFDLIDDSESGELDSVDSADFKPVVDACTLCDLCFMVSCPYVPPHEFDLDYPHLMLRYRAVENRKGKVPFTDREIAKTDRNGKLAGSVASLANWGTSLDNKLGRRVLEKAAHIHPEAKLPEYHGKTFAMRAKSAPPTVNKEAPAFGRKVVLYATCFVNYNNPDIGLTTQKVLAHNGVETEVVYPECCGMPMLELGDLDGVAAKAQRVAEALGPWIDKGYDIVAMVPSCALMLKFEWPLLQPENEAIAKLAKHTSDVSQYVVDIAGKEGLAEGLKPLDGGVSVHLACHARAQNIGPKAVEMLRLIPEIDLAVIERCSGHGGAWGTKEPYFPVALKVGRPAARAALKNNKAYLTSECPLAREHILQGMEKLQGEPVQVSPSTHPIELIARAYGFVD
ncbi:MAG: glycerol-3-phosphate dehydrogenase [Rhodospirillaceae bacterium]|nr:glycerol-3-phosphate dehydrogenase [Rhodospirillaceae bacterium]|tara:strand:- start:1654 stop:2994 length:1341 start_codon:yes stop_codon:yes gene_type:complete